MQKHSRYRILLLGSGGREHTLGWKIAQSPRCDALFIAPGNGGTGEVGTNIALNLKDFASLGAFCIEERINMLVVGPEAPLVDGIVDYFTETHELSHILCIGPSQSGAQLEGSKDFAKRFMQRHQIPTAAYSTFSAETFDAGSAYISRHSTPLVLKADGLAAGKGVLICQSREEALLEFELMLGGKFGIAGSTVVVEEFLTGIEFSVFVLTDGAEYFLLPIAKDYKRIGESDTGLNTGGMGSISPVPFVDASMMDKVRARIIEPTIRGIQKEGILYKGFVFFGLINVAGDPYVIEYNCRMGDPETESVIPRMRNDVVDLFEAVHRGTLGSIQPDIDPRYAATIVCASAGYPGEYPKGLPIGLPGTADSLIFHAGTQRADVGLVTSGGRVFAVTSLGETLDAALAKSNTTAAQIQYDGKYFRKDIGFDLK